MGQWNRGSQVGHNCKFDSKAFLKYIPSNERTAKENFRFGKVQKMTNFYIIKWIILNKKADNYESKFKKRNNHNVKSTNKIYGIQKKIHQIKLAIQFKFTDNII